MQTAHKLNWRSARIEGENANEIIVIIAYDDLKAGQRAGQLFSSVARRGIRDIQFRLQPWRFDFLADPEWSQFAIAEARQADLLVLAMTHSSDLPAAVQHWLNKWFDGKRGDHAALVALVDDAVVENSSTMQFLQHGAEDAGLDFFTPLVSHQCDTNILPYLAPEDFSYRKPYRHWGLNE
jgi:hypothetical protein